MKSKRLEAIVKGYVQGVGFRHFVKYHAVSLALTGFVKNLPSGEVEVVAEGNEESLESFLSILKRGSVYSNVEKVDYVIKEAKDEFPDFYIY